MDDFMNPFSCCSELVRQCFQISGEMNGIRAFHYDGSGRHVQAKSDEPARSVAGPNCRGARSGPEAASGDGEARSEAGEALKPNY
jgi:hypothetical protein